MLIQPDQIHEQPRGRRRAHIRPRQRIGLLLQAFCIEQQPVHVEDYCLRGVEHIQPFTPVMVMPRMKERRAKKNTSTMGSVITVADAKVRP